MFFGGSTLTGNGHAFAIAIPCGDNHKVNQLVACKIQSHAIETGVHFLGVNITDCKTSTRALLSQSFRIRLEQITLYFGLDRE